MAEQVLLAVSTFPDEETARRVVRELVETGLVACGNIIPRVESIYRWQGRTETAAEAMAFFKLSGERYTEFETKLKSLHPYDVPEIVAVDLAKGLPEYLRWVCQSGVS